ncbi:hypothetical protein PtB15_2B251 [Puccinia triticina]|nr:hypothetical protein PtB15_2B251 [Puccinia triticina]
MGRSHRLGGFLGVVCKDKRATQRHVPRSLASSPTSSTIQTSTILRLKYLSQPHSFSTDRTAANMMLKAAWILVASLFIGKSAELAVPYTKQDPSSYDQYRPGGKPGPIPWSGQPGSASSSQNGTVQDAARKQGTPDETAEEPYKKGSYGSYQPQPAKKWAGDGSDLEGKPGAEDSGASGAWQSVQRHLARLERHGMYAAPVFSSLNALPSADMPPFLGPRRAASATSRPGEKLEDPSKQPHGRSFVAPEPPVDGDAQSPTSKGPFGHNDDSHKLPQPIYHPVSSPKPTYPDSGY